MFNCSLLISVRLNIFLKRKKKSLSQESSQRYFTNYTRQISYGLKGLFGSIRYQNVGSVKILNKKALSNIRKPF